MRLKGGPDRAGSRGQKAGVRTGLEWTSSPDEERHSKLSLCIMAVVLSAGTIAGLALFGPRFWERQRKGIPSRKGKGMPS